jgi:septal ring factor EnvC (AmiA/AmiB activator)
MAQWSERYKNHQVWQLLQNLGPAIDNAFNRDGNDVETLDGLSRLKSVLSFVGKRLAGSDPYLIQTTVFDNLGSHLHAATNEVQNFVANGNTGHIINANTNADAILSLLTQINVPITTEDFLSAKEAAESYRQGVEKSLTDIKVSTSQITNQIDSIQARINELSAELTAERARLSAITGDFQNQFSAAQEARNVAFSGDQQARQDRANEFQNQFSAAQEARNSVFINDQKERLDRFNGLVAEYSQKLIEQSNEYTKQRNDLAIAQQTDIQALRETFVNESDKIHDEIVICF